MIVCSASSPFWFWQTCVLMCLQHVQNDSPSSKSLAGLVVQLLQFQEDAFGRRVNNPALTKLPVRPSTFSGSTITTLWNMAASDMLLSLLPGQMFPGLQGRRRSLPHPGLGLQVQERAGLVSVCSGITCHGVALMWGRLPPSHFFSWKKCHKLFQTTHQPYQPHQLNLNSSTTPWLCV